MVVAHPVRLAPLALTYRILTVAVMDGPVLWSGKVEAIDRRSSADLYPATRTRLATWIRRTIASSCTRGTTFYRCVERG